MTMPDQGAQGGTPDGQSAGEGTGTGNTDPNAGTQSGAGDQGQGQSNSAGTVSLEEHERIRARMTAADQRAGKAEAELRQLKDKDIPALQKAERDLVDMTARAEKAETELKQARLDNAFFNDNKYKWKNPKTALKVADLSKVEVDEDGTVTGLTAALDALAKSDPYLLEDKPSDESNDDEGKGSKGSTGALGTGGKQPKGTDDKALAARFPSLRTRGVGL